jgi:hypothetical protein
VEVRDVDVVAVRDVHVRDVDVVAVRDVHVRHVQVGTMSMVEVAPHRLGKRLGLGLRLGALGEVRVDVLHDSSLLRGSMRLTSTFRMAPRVDRECVAVPCYGAGEERDKNEG